MIVNRSDWIGLLEWSGGDCSRAELMKMSGESMTSHMTRGEFISNELK
jgi:hypothetical protein